MDKEALDAYRGVHSFAAPSFATILFQLTLQCLHVGFMPVTSHFTSEWVEHRSVSTLWMINYLNWSSLVRLNDVEIQLSRAAGDSRLTESLQRQRKDIESITHAFAAVVCEPGVLCSSVLRSNS